MEQVDVSIENHGSVFMFRIHTNGAQEWVDENVGIEGWQWLGNGFAVDPHYVDELGCAMMDAGLYVTD